MLNDIIKVDIMHSCSRHGISNYKMSNRIIFKYVMLVDNSSDDGNIDPKYKVDMFRIR